MPKKIEKVEEVKTEPVKVIEQPPVEGPMVTKTLKQPFFLNGIKYGPGLCEVPTDAFHLWKGCL